MKTSKLLPLIVFILGIGQLSFAQKGKVDGALNSFLNTEFMTKFKDMRIEAEVAVRNFKMKADSYDPDAVKKVQTGYDQTAYRFNQVLKNIKADFLNSKKLKYIAKFPDSYIKGLELELYQLNDFYAIHFLQPLADATESEEDGIFLALLSELIGLTKGLFGYFGQIKREARHYNESYLNKHLINPYRFRYWDELSPEGVNPGEFENMDTDIPEQSDFDPSFPDLNINPSAFEKEENQSDYDEETDNPYDEADTYDEFLDQEDGSVKKDSTNVQLRKIKNNKTKNKAKSKKSSKAAPKTKKKEKQ